MNENENRLFATNWCITMRRCSARFARTWASTEPFIKQLSEEVSASMAQATDKVSDRIPSNEEPMRNELLANAIEAMQVIERGAIAELRFQEGH
jgi:hypothetical protein